MSTHAEQVGRGLDDALRQLHAALAKHPLAAKAICAALVREGRAYGETEEGRRLRERLLRSEHVTRLRSAWELISSGAMDDEAKAGRVPSALLEGLVQSVFRPRFESRLHRALRSRGSRIEGE